jgi:hypothetical protein
MSRARVPGVPAPPKSPGPHPANFSSSSFFSFFQRAIWESGAREGSTPVSSTVSRRGEQLGDIGAGTTIGAGDGEGGGE